MNWRAKTLPHESVVTTCYDRICQKPDCLVILKHLETQEAQSNHETQCTQRPKYKPEGREDISNMHDRKNAPPKNLHHAVITKAT